MKDTFYFTHDYNARSDRKLVNLTIKHGMGGLGIYWCIIEMLYEEGGYLPLEFDTIAFQLRSELTDIESVINDFELFENDQQKFWSKTVLDRLTVRAEKSEKARKSINSRWNEYKSNTNVLQTNKERNTKKESKVTDRIVGESKQKETKAGERIGKENLNSKSISEVNKINPEDRIQEGDSGIFQDAEKGFQNQNNPRARALAQALVEKIFLEDELCLSDLTGLPSESIADEHELESKEINTTKPDHNTKTLKKGFTMNKIPDITRIPDDW